MKQLICVCLVVLPAVASAQNPKGATYITAEEVALINKSPGVDRQIVNVDIGKSNLAVGVVHRGRSGAPPAAPAGGGGAAAAAASAAPPQPCGEKVATLPAGTASGIAHDGQTETYIIISGGGTSSPVAGSSMAGAQRPKAR
jgi:hypothetical protein